MSEAIIDKIRALLRKTEAAGCTPEEADAAMRAAAKLMAKHNIERVVLESAEAEEAAKQRLDLVKEYHNTGREKCYTDEHIQRILRQCFCVKVFYTSAVDFDDYNAQVEKYQAGREAYYTWFNLPDEARSKAAKPKPPGRWPKMKPRYTYVLVGDKPDVQMGIALIQEFRRIMRHGLARHLRETGAGWTAVAADSYYAGFAAGYIDANLVAVKEAVLEAGEAAAATYTLAVVDKTKAVEAFASEKVQTVRARAGSGNGARSYGYDEAAAKKGRAAGSKLNLKGARLQ